MAGVNIFGGFWHDPEVLFQHRQGPCRRPDTGLTRAAIEAGISAYVAGAGSTAQRHGVHIVIGLGMRDPLREGVMRNASLLIGHGGPSAGRCQRVQMTEMPGLVADGFAGKPGRRVSASTPGSNCRGAARQTLWHRDRPHSSCDTTIERRRLRTRRCKQVAGPVHLHRRRSGCTRLAVRGIVRKASRTRRS
nr:hypothetical protein [Paracoccus mutanolyticus]